MIKRVIAHVRGGGYVSPDVYVAEASTATLLCESLVSADIDTELVDLEGPEL